MPDTINMVMNRQYEVLRIDNIEHGKKDFLRKAALVLATQLLENGDIIEHRTNYDVKLDGFVTSLSIITCRKRRN